MNKFACKLHGYIVYFGMGTDEFDGCNRSKVKVGRLKNGLTCANSLCHVIWHHMMFWCDIVIWRLWAIKLTRIMYKVGGRLNAQVFSLYFRGAPPAWNLIFLPTSPPLFFKWNSPYLIPWHWRPLVIWSSRESVFVLSLEGSDPCEPLSELVSLRMSSTFPGSLLWRNKVKIL